MSDRSVPSTLDLRAEHLVIDDVSVVRLDGGPPFWQRLAAGDPALDVVRRGWLVATFDYTADWTHWEVHPAGDEIVHVLAGAVDLVIDVGAAEPEVVPLGAGDAVVVPAGVWHTAVVRRPAAAVHITYGDGTRHRPLDEGPRVPAG